MNKEQLISIAKVMNAKFSLNEQAISHAEVFAETGLLPGIARRADQLSALAMGYGIGVTFDEEQGSKLGVKAKFDDVTPNSLRYLCIADVLNELMQKNTVAGITKLDELLYD
mgnify:CR=1 FL=1